MTRTESYSSLSTLAECAHRYSLRYVEGLESPGISLPAHAGGALHEGLRSLYTEGWDEEKAKEAVRTSWGDIKPPLGSKHPWLTKGFAEARIVAYMREREAAPTMLEEGKVLPGLAETEHVFEWAGETGVIPVKVVLDMAVEIKGKVWVVDNKAQPLDAPVLTPWGWKPIGAISLGDVLIGGGHGHPVCVRGIYPKGEIDAYEVKLRDGTKIVCGEDHIWWVKNINRQAWELKSTKALLEAPDYTTFGIPVTPEVQFGGQEDLAISPYLLGALLGDGCLTGNSVSFSCAEEELVELVRAELPDDVELRGKQKTSYSYNITGNKKNSRNSLLKALDWYGLTGKYSYNKFIPEVYKRASVSSRMSVLQGLLDTDGGVDAGRIYYDTTSPQLAEDVMEVVRSLGGKASSRYDACAKHKWAKRGKYRIRIRLPEWMPAFRLSRKRDKVEFSPKGFDLRGIESVTKLEGQQEMVCIEVDGGLYITEGMTVTHNCTTGWVNSHWAMKFRIGNQARMYAAFLQQSLGMTVSGALINAIYMGDKALDPPKAWTSRKSSPTSLIRLDFTQEQINESRDWVEGLTRQRDAHAASGLWPRNEMACNDYGACEYLDLCSAPSAMVRKARASTAYTKRTRA